MFDVYVYHHHSLLYSGCTLVLQYNLITQHIHTVYMHMYKGDLWNAANICGLAIYIYSDWNAKMFAKHHISSILWPRVLHMHHIAH